MKIGCVLLASGLSRRFGRNKLLETVNGKLLIEHTFGALPVDLFSETVVVTAYDEIEKLARIRGFRVVRHPNPQLGIGSTIKLGIAALEKSDACMICVCDQPNMNKNILRQMVQAYAGGILAIAYDGRRGNPVIFPEQLFSELLEIEDEQSGKTVIERHMDMLRLFSAAGEQELMDVDTKADMQRVVPNAVSSVRD